MEEGGEWRCPTSQGWLLWSVDAAKKKVLEGVDMASQGVSLLKVTGRVMQKAEQHRVAAALPLPTSTEPLAMNTSTPICFIQLQK